MFRWLHDRRVAAKRDAIATERALAEFRARRRLEPMGGHIIRREDEAIIVRVMYLTDHIPPDRAWYRVSSTTGAVRELMAEEAHDTAIWR